MKNRYLFILAGIALAFISTGVCFAQNVKRVDELCERCGDISEAPFSYPQKIKKCQTLVFTTYNGTHRRYQIILAKKDAGGKYHTVACARVKYNHCTDLAYTSTVDETLYVFYRYQKWYRVAWKNALGVSPDSVVACGPQKARLTVTKQAGISAAKGGAGVATTTVDDKTKVE